MPEALFLYVEDLSGKTYAFARDRWTAGMPTAEEADTLDLALGAVVVHVVPTADADDGTILEISEWAWPAEPVMILDEYPITPEADTPPHPRRSDDHSGCTAPA